MSSFCAVDVEKGNFKRRACAIIRVDVDKLVDGTFDPRGMEAMKKKLKEMGWECDWASARKSDRATSGIVNLYPPERIKLDLKVHDKEWVKTALERCFRAHGKTDRYLTGAWEIVIDEHPKRLRGYFATRKPSITRKIVGYKQMVMGDWKYTFEPTDQYLRPKSYTSLATYTGDLSFSHWDKGIFDHLESVEKSYRRQRPNPPVSLHYDPPKDGQQWLMITPSNIPFARFICRTLSTHDYPFDPVYQINTHYCNPRRERTLQQVRKDENEARQREARQRKREEAKAAPPTWVFPRKRRRSEDAGEEETSKRPAMALLTTDGSDYTEAATESQIQVDMSHPQLAPVGGPGDPEEEAKGTYSKDLNVS